MNPTPGYTFSQILLELAEAAGVLSESGGLPANEYELSKLKRKVNLGIKDLAALKPSGWKRLIQDVSITCSVDGKVALNQDSSRYPLPSGVGGQPVGPWTWMLATGTESGYADSTSWERIAHLLAGDTITGAPCAVAVRPSDPRPDDAAIDHERIRWQVRIHPRPDRAYTLTAPFAISVSDLVELEERHPFGADLDTAVLAAAKWVWVRDDREDARRSDWKNDYDLAAAMAIAKDNQLAPFNLGPLTDPAMHGRRGNHHSILDLTLNGVRLNP